MGEGVSPPFRPGRGPRAASPLFVPRLPVSAVIAGWGRLARSGFHERRDPGARLAGSGEKRCGAGAPYAWEALARPGPRGIAGGEAGGGARTGLGLVGVDARVLGTSWQFDRRVPKVPGGGYFPGLPRGGVQGRRGGGWGLGEAWLGRELEGEQA